MICFTGCVAACVSPERATDYRQVVECAARNPCKHGKRISNPDGVTEFCRAFGTFKIFAFIAGVSLRFTACLYSVQAFGLPSTLARDSPPSEGRGRFPPPFTGGVGGWVFRRCSRPAAGSTSQSSARAEERS